MYEPAECERIAEQTTSYLEDALPPAVRQDFEAHLEKCRRCQRHLREMRWTIDHLAALPPVPVPPAMKERLLRALRDRRSA
jgi:anti-sigma factor RsiW